MGVRARYEALSNIAESKKAPLQAFMDIRTTLDQLHIRMRDGTVDNAFLKELLLRLARRTTSAVLL